MRSALRTDSIWCWKWKAFFFQNPEIFQAVSGQQHPEEVQRLQRAGVFCRCAGSISVLPGLPQPQYVPGYAEGMPLSIWRCHVCADRHVFTPILDRFHVPPSDQKYMMPFYINGLMGIVNEWLKEDCRDSVEHIVSVIQICITERK